MISENEIAHTEDRLLNWGRWATSLGAVRSTCASMERYYVAPRPDDAAVDRVRAAIDVNDAELVERVVVSFTGRNQRRFILGLWGRRRSASELARQCGFDHKLFDGYRRLVVIAVAKRLAKAEARHVGYFARLAKFACQDYDLHPQFDPGAS